MTTYKDLLFHFRSLGLKKGMTIEVHSSLSSFGFVDGGAKTVIKVLMDIITTSGTIVMPTFPLSRPYPIINIDKELGIFFKREYWMTNLQKKVIWE